MQFPGEGDSLAERAALIETLESLTEEEFEHGTTLCDGWSPRDVAAHLVGIDSSTSEYLRSLGNVNKANAAIVENYRALDRAELMARVRQWASSPSTPDRALSWVFLGDLCMHHQDILRGLGRQRSVPAYARAALLRESSVLGARKLLGCRIEPTDGGRPRGRHKVVRGSSEALALWLAGRKGIEPELDFVDDETR